MGMPERNVETNTAHIEIEDNTLTTAHIGREVEVLEPGRPSWTGRITGWTEEHVLISQSDQSPVERILPAHLHWIV